MKTKTKMKGGKPKGGKGKTQDAGKHPDRKIMMAVNRRNKSKPC